MNTQTFSPITTNVKFKKEWTPDQFKSIEKAIVKHFNRRVYLRYCTSGEMTATRIYASYSQIDEILGLAYTSTSKYAGYWICNVTASFDEENIYHYNAFTIGNNGKFYAVLQDDNENELCIEL